MGPLPLVIPGGAMVYIGEISFLLLLTGVIWFVISQLRVKYGTSVHVIWYLSSLAWCAAIIALPWAQDAGVIDVQGRAINAPGKVFMGIFNFSLDLIADFRFLSGLVFLIIGPQLLSYLLSGAFGCASRPRLFACCVDFFAWGMAKSSAIAAGVLLAATLVGWRHHWSGFDAENCLKYARFAWLLLTFSFVALMGKATVDEIPVLADSRQLAPLRRWVLAQHQKMVRHRQPDSQGIWLTRSADTKD